MRNKWNNETSRWGHLVFALLIVPSMMLLGCQTVMTPYSGGTLAPSSLIPLQEGSRHTDHYETLDILVDYDYVRNGDTLQLAGAVRYAPSLQHNFIMVPRFYMRLYFADARGNALSYFQLPVSGYGYSDDVMRFNDRWQLPPGTAFMAFGYDGYARDTGGHHDDGGGSAESHFFYDPAIH